MTTIPAVAQSSIENRLALLEEQVAVILRNQPPAKDWTSTGGTVREDEFAREADKLGDEWRKGVTD